MVFMGSIKCRNCNEIIDINIDVDVEKVYGKDKLVKCESCGELHYIRTVTRYTCDLYVNEMLELNGNFK